MGEGLIRQAGLFLFFPELARREAEVQTATAKLVNLLARTDPRLGEVVEQEVVRRQEVFTRLQQESARAYPAAPRVRALESVCDDLRAGRL